MSQSERISICFDAFRITFPLITVLVDDAVNFLHDESKQKNNNKDTWIIFLKTHQGQKLSLEKGTRKRSKNLYNQNKT